MITDLIQAGLSLIDKIIPDKKAADEAKLKLLQLEQNGDLKEIEAKSNIIISEAKSDSWLASNWRPIIMLLFGIIIANNYIISPWLHACGFISVALPIPDRMWSLLELGLGGYVIGRSAEKAVKAWKES
jgi:hypothetical protein